MKWGECRLRTLQTIFANAGPRLVEDDSNREYLDAMPGAANEGMQQLALVGRPILRKLTIAVGVEEEGAVSLPSGTGTLKVDLSQEATRFRAVDRLMLESDGSYDDAWDWDMEGDTVLLLPAAVVGIYSLWYKAYPAEVSATTPEDTDLELPEDAAALLPLYIASKIYKDDELSTATVIRNEYEDGLSKLRAAYEESQTGIRVGAKANTTGWW